MFDIESVKTQHLASVAPYVPKLFDSVKPLLENVDKSILSEESAVTVHLEGRHRFLEVRVETKESDIPGVYLHAAKGWCQLDLFEAPLVEDHHPTSDPEFLIELVCSRLRRYLEGITVVY
jgi:hypothetical protein